jgi:O-methyltransferase involved in polyketide biosynthesis
MTRHQPGPVPGGPDETSAGMATIQLNTSVPNAARIYDYLLGGKDNFAADRKAAELIGRQIPHSAAAAHQNRAFLGRVVRLLADTGIRQFLDIGSGLPTKANVHQIAQQVDPASRVVYVDYDVLAVSHARALLQKGSDYVTVVPGDLRDPGKIIRDTEDLLDFSQPVAILLFAILHFLRDDEKPHEVVRTLTDALPAGGALALSHITNEGIGEDKSRAAQQVYEAASAPVVPRSLAEMWPFFDGLALLAPGVTDIALWPVRQVAPEIPLSFYGGVGIKA